MPAGGGATAWLSWLGGSAGVRGNKIIALSGTGDLPLNPPCRRTKSKDDSLIEIGRTGMTGTVFPSAQVKVVEWPAVAKADKRPVVALREVVPVGLLGLPVVLTKDQCPPFFIEQIRARRPEPRFPS